LKTSPPWGFTKIEYLEKRGNQFIDTNYGGKCLTTTVMSLENIGSSNPYSRWNGWGASGSFQNSRGSVWTIMKNTDANTCWLHLYASWDMQPKEPIPLGTPIEITHWHGENLSIGTRIRASETNDKTTKAGGVTTLDSDRNSELPTNLYTDQLHTMGHTSYASYDWGEVDGESNFSRTFDFDANGEGGIAADDSETFSAIEKPAGSRHANSSRVKVEIRCGRDKSNIFSLSAVQIDYVKAPQFIRLTQEQLDSDEDISQVMEFPDYVNQEIVNELVNLVMRKTNDPSLQAHMQMTQSIARPTGQSQQPAAQA
jgi:hypothetical protein